MNKKVNALIDTFQPGKKNVFQIRPCDIFQNNSKYPLFIEKQYQRKIAWVTSKNELITELLDCVFGSFKRECELSKDKTYRAFNGYCLNSMIISELDNDPTNGIVHSLIDASNRVNSIFCFLNSLELLSYDMGYITREEYINNLKNIFFFDIDEGVLNIDTNFENMNYKALWNILSDYDKTKTKNKIQINYDNSSCDMPLARKGQDLIYVLFVYCLNTLIQNNIHDDFEILVLFKNYINKCTWFETEECSIEEKARRFYNANNYTQPLNDTELIKSILTRYGTNDNGIINMTDSLFEKIKETKFYVQTKNNDALLKELFFQVLKLEKNTIEFSDLTPAFLIKLTNENEILGNETKSREFLNNFFKIIDYLNQFDTIDERNLCFRKLNGGVYVDNIVNRLIFLALFYIDRECVSDYGKRNILKDILFNVYFTQNICCVFGSHSATERSNTTLISNFIIDNIKLPISELKEKLINYIVDLYSKSKMQKNGKKEYNKMQEMAKNFDEIFGNITYSKAQYVRMAYYIIEYKITRDFNVSCKHIFKEDTHIDHILSQQFCNNLNIDDNICNNIGNLTLLESDLNKKKSSNNDFVQYLNSEFYSTSLMHKKTKYDKYTFIKLKEQYNSKREVQEAIFDRRDFIVSFVKKCLFLDKVKL